MFGKQIRLTIDPSELELDYLSSIMDDDVMIPMVYQNTDNESEPDEVVGHISLNKADSILALPERPKIKKHTLCGIAMFDLESDRAQFIVNNVPEDWSYRMTISDGEIVNIIVSE